MSSSAIGVRRAWYWIVIIYCLAHAAFIPFLVFKGAGGDVITQPPVWGWWGLWAAVHVVIIGGLTALAIYWGKSNVCLTLFIIYLFLDFIMRMTITFSSNAVHFRETFNNMRVFYEAYPMDAAKVFGLIFYCLVWVVLLGFSFAMYKINRELKALKKK